MRENNRKKPTYEDQKHDCKPPAPARRGEQGYVLVVFILFAALLLVGLSTIIPKAAFEGRRDKEEELIFRGLQYQRAIQLFVRKFGRYPNSVEELEKTNGIRFLRKRYKDPMTKDGAWRLIHLGPGGAFVDALTSPLHLSTPGSAPASGPNPSQQGGTGLQSSPGMTPTGGLLQSGTGQSSGQPSTAGPSSFGGLPGGGTQPGEPALAPSANPGANPLLQPRASAQGQQPTGGTSPGGSQDASASSQPTSGSPIIGGGAIAGFASRSKEESIRVWNTYSEYDKWEFIYDVRQDQLAAAALARMGATQTQPTPQLPATGQPQPSTIFPGASVQPQPGAPPGQPGPTSPQFPISPIPGGFPPPRQR